MPRGLLGIAAACTLGAIALPASSPAHAQRQAQISESAHLWATVNVCDTEDHPDVVGIRASMPGSGRREVLWMRFEVQYRSPDDGQWHAIDDGADSGWQRVGVSVTRRIESGWNFMFKAPGAGGEHVLRGAVSFRWTREGRTIRRLREITVGGHKSTRGADPEGYSAATCRIS
jgi:hypothetical protein